MIEALGDRLLVIAVIRDITERLAADEELQRAHEVLFYVGLGEARYRNLETYSTGMKQRIKLAQAMPRIIPMAR